MSPQRRVLLSLRSSRPSAVLSAGLGAGAMLALVWLVLIGSASAITPVAGFSFPATAGLTYSGSVASFSDDVQGTSGGDGSPGGFSCVGSHTFSAAINWGDGTTSDGTVVNTGGGGHSQACQYSVSGRHVYAAGSSGQRAVSVTVSASDTTTTIDSTANVTSVTSPNLLRDIPNTTTGPDNGQVYAVARAGNLIYLGGSFTSIAGVSSHPYLAAIDANTGLVDASFNPPSPDGPVRALALSSDQSRLYVGGQFTKLGAVAPPGPHLAALDAATGSPVAGWSGSSADVVYALALAGSPETLYAAGASTSGQDVAPIHAFTTTGTASPNFFAAVLGRVYALAATSDGLYVGGDFSAVNGDTTKAYLVGLDPMSGQALPTWQDPGLDGPVLSLATLGSTVYAGGSFLTTDGGVIIRHGLAAFNANGQPVVGFNPMADDTVTGLAVGGGRLYAAGDFTAVGGAARLHVSALDPATGAADPTWDPGVGGSSSPAATVDAIAATANDLSIGGLFASSGGMPASDLAYFTFAPRNFVAPAIKGIAQQGRKLTCSVGLWTNSPTSFTAHWLRDGSEVLSANPTIQYSVGAADVGHSLVCKIVAANASGTGTALSAATPRVIDAPDKTPPAITVNSPRSGASYRQGTHVRAIYSCRDEAGGSGLASCKGTVPAGHAIDTSHLGSHTFSVTAQDIEGHTRTVVVHYTVQR